MKILGRMKKGDFILVLLIGIIVTISLLWIYFYSGTKQSDSLIASITRDGKIIQKIDLNKVNTPRNIKLKSNGYHLTVLAEKKRIRVLKADCPDKICVNFGWLTKPGDNAICVPSKIIVMIEGQEK
jgi:hypothetical protein